MSIRYHRYHIEYIKHHEIICPRYTFADGTYVIVIPWYLIPGRPYPVQVYMCACSLYSTNPEIGQRGAAKATREKFKLEAFSHSTVSRSFRAFEQARKLALESRFGEEIKACGAGAPMLVGAAAKHESKRDEASDSATRFPTVMDTAERRKEMAEFFREFFCAAEGQDIKAIEAAGRQFSRNWHEKTRRLII